MHFLLSLSCSVKIVFEKWKIKVVLLVRGFREREKNGLMCIKDSEGVSVFTVTHFVCSSTLLPYRPCEHAHYRLKIARCVVQHAPEETAGWSVFLTSSPLLLLHSFIWNQEG